MTSSTPDAWLGAQQPRIYCATPYEPGLLAELALELAVEIAQMGLYPWQRSGLAAALAQGPDGSLAARQVGFTVPRQNGKDEIIAARSLAALYLDELDEELTTHTAHEAKTAMQAFYRLKGIIQAVPDLRRRVQSFSHARGDEGILMRNGKQINFRTRTANSGRGFTGELLFLNEAMILAAAALASLLPTMSATSVEGSPQVWFTGSAVDQQVHEHGQIFANVRQLALSGKSKSLVYFEWSLDVEGPEHVTPEMAMDRELLALTNPSLGRLIDPEFIYETEHAIMPSRQFAVERLNAGDWPSSTDYGMVIDSREWELLADPTSTFETAWFAFDVQPDRGRASIGAAGLCEDGTTHVELVDNREGTDWLPARLAELTSTHRNGGVRYDGAGPSGSLIPALEEVGVEAEPFTAREHASACGLLYDNVKQGKVRHRGQAALRDAIRGAKKRPLGDAWAWDRKNSAVDISPLVAVTLAAWGAATADTYKEPWIAWR